MPSCPSCSPPRTLPLSTKAVSQTSVGRRRVGFRRAPAPASSKNPGEADAPCSECPACALRPTGNAPIVGISDGPGREFPTRAVRQGANPPPASSAARANFANFRNFRRFSGSLREFSTKPDAPPCVTFVPCVRSAQPLALVRFFATPTLRPRDSPDSSDAFLRHPTHRPRAATSWKIVRIP